MLIHLVQVVTYLTSHGVGLKRILLSGNETESAVTQIAVTKLAEGEVAAEAQMRVYGGVFLFPERGGVGDC